MVKKWPSFRIGNQNFTFVWDFPARCEETGRVYFLFHRHTASGRCITI